MITNWKVPDAELIFCHSFLTLKPLLNCFESIAVQLFAIWTINDLLSKNREHYFKILFHVRIHYILRYYFYFES